MSYWAQIDKNNIVVNVTVGDNNDPNGDEGYQWLIDNIGGRWIKTSFNTIAGVHSLGGIPFRKNFAGIGYTYDENRDAFIPPKNHESWTLNEDSCIWVAPIQRPNDEKMYFWDEESLSWKEINELI
jgi:hypothetical protein